MTKGAAIPTVCIDCRYISDRPSGIAEVVRALVDHAPALAPDLHFRLLTHPSAPSPLSTAANVGEHSVKIGANSPASMWFLPECAPVADCDVFHAPANILPARLNIPSVTTVHDIMWLTDPQWCDPSAYGLVKRQFYGHGLRRALNQSSKIAVVSEATRAAIAAHDPRVQDRLTLTRSGVSPRFKPVEADSAVLHSMGIGPGMRYVLAVGQYAPYKNHEGALTAFARAFAQEPDARLVFVQRQGPSTAPLASLAEKLGVADQVIFAGSVGGDALLQLYSNAVMLLHPSFCEGFGNPVAEAMACGCPVITSNMSAMPEVAGGAAALADPYDNAQIAVALRKVWESAAFASGLREAGLARARQLDWADFARANIALYRSILTA